MNPMNISEARGILPTLVERVASTGVPVVLLRYGKPTAMLVPCAGKTRKSERYPLRDMPLELSADFDEPLDGLWDAARVAESGEKYKVAHKAFKQPVAKRRRA